VKRFLLKTRTGLRIRSWNAPLGYTRKGWEFTKWKTVEKFDTFLDACVRMKNLTSDLGQAKIVFSGKLVAQKDSEEFARFQPDNPEHVQAVTGYEKTLRGWNL
tara:strand:- start:81 stop:389 length:309 start_codon:yes stop_codon:yes gene_type:complete